MNARLESECMSDYLFMLENHLSTDQNRVVAEVQAAASVANFNLFLTGGAMRDMLGGFPMLELDFTVEGNAPKLAQTVAKKTGAKLLDFGPAKVTPATSSSSMISAFPLGTLVHLGLARALTEAGSLASHSCPFIQRLTSAHAKTLRPPAKCGENRVDTRDFLRTSRYPTLAVGWRACASSSSAPRA